MAQGTGSRTTSTLIGTAAIVVAAVAYLQLSRPDNTATPPTRPTDAPIVSLSPSTAASASTSPSETSSPSPTTTGTAGQTLTGTLKLTDGGAGWSAHSPCQGQGAFDDLTVGTPVMLRDGAGQIISRGPLRLGTAGDPVSDTNDTAIECAMPFTVAGVTPSETYELEITDRGTLRYSRADLTTKSWTIVVELR